MLVCTVVLVLLHSGTRSAANLINNAEQLPHVQDAGSSPLPHGAGPGPVGHPSMAHHHHPVYPGTQERVRLSVSLSLRVNM